MKRNIGQHPSEQAEEQIRFIIRSLGLKANDRIPSERELSEMCALSRNTVRSATKFLISEGTLYSEPGKGNYLSPAPVILNPLDTASLTETAEKQGKRLRNEIIKARIAFS
jgi:DNA-binding GntR family transcriptional regulator